MIYAGKAWDWKGIHIFLKAAKVALMDKLSAKSQQNGVLNLSVSVLKRSRRKLWAGSMSWGFRIM